MGLFYYPEASGQSATEDARQVDTDLPGAVSIYSDMKKVESRRQFNHDSVILYRNDSVVRPVRILQRGGLGRVTSLSGSEHESVHEVKGHARLRTGNFDYRMPPSTQANPTPDYLRMYLRNLRRHYHINMTGQTIIAGEPAWIISVYVTG